MCGICGILLRDPEARVPEADIRIMNDQMVHRGPDAEGYFRHGNLALGHRRLSIIDLAGGIQPMASADGNLVTIFNGEIYNFKEIRADLETRGHRFQTSSDTEVILQAYAAYGDTCVDHFRGMFSIALLDKSKNRLLLLRDRLGIKPLYYYLDDDRLVFASEIKSIHALLKKKSGINFPALDMYMAVGYVPGDKTLFANIRKLEPGHRLIAENGKIEIGAYWDLEDTPALELNFDEALEGFAELAMESVRLRMRSDVPLGAFLSGGVDSSVIVGLMTKLSETPVNTFSVGYRNAPESNELGYARQVADHFNTNHHEYVLEPADFFESLDLLLCHTEEPIVESAAVALYQISKLARDHVTVILSGEGGDEILAGYPLHQIMPRVDKLHGLCGLLPQAGRRLFSGWISGHEKACKYWDWISEPLATRYQSISNDVTLGIKKNMYLNGALLDAHYANSAYFNSIFETMSQGTDLRKMTYTDLKTWLPDDLLVKADKMTMAASLELRVPFLDHKLLEYATALPDEFRLNGNEGKYLMKKFAGGLLPENIIYRKKQGFPVPIAAWFRDKLYDRTREILLDNASQSRGYFKPGYVENLLQKHRDGKQDLSRRIFSLLNLELWHRKYIDPA